MSGKYLTFQTAEQLFAVPIADVEQILQLREAIGIPEVPAYVKGIIRLRGVVIPVIDMRIRLGWPETEYGDRAGMIVVRGRAKTPIALLVDQAREVIDIPDKWISGPPVVGGGPENDYLTGVAALPTKDHKEQLVLLLDGSKLLREREAETLVESAAAREA